MSQHDTYVLHIWRSRAHAGDQWVARVECLSDGQQLRFADPQALLNHLQSVIHDNRTVHQSSEIGGAGPRIESTTTPDNR